MTGDTRSVSMLRSCPCQERLVNLCLTYGFLFDPEHASGFTIGTHPNRWNPCVKTVSGIPRVKFFAQEKSVRQVAQVYRVNSVRQPIQGIAKAKGRYKGRPKTIDRSEILTLLDDGLSMRKTAGKLGVSLSTVQRMKIENLTCFGVMDH